jgi:predicted porin
MKKSLLAVAVLGAFAGAASAQSSVTLFGVVDLSANSIKNGSTTQYSLQSNQLNSNRLGFRGTEDLGGGLAAGFWLEAGMNNDTGNVGGSNGLATPANGTSFFNRRSTVSLISGAGELRLGRDYNPSFWNTVFFDVYGANGIGQFDNLLGAATLGSSAATFARSNNSIGYFLPSGLGGIYGQAQVAAGENVAGQKYMGGRLGYAAGPIDVAVGYGKTETGGSLPDFKVMNFGGSFNMGFAKIFGLYNKLEYGSRQLKTWGVSGSVPMGQGEFKAGYTKSDQSGAGFDADDASQWSVQYIYNLSKRTALYTSYASLSNDGKANFQVLGNGGSAAGTNSKGYNFGVRHSF